MDEGTGPTAALGDAGRHRDKSSECRRSRDSGNAARCPESGRSQYSTARRPGRARQLRTRVESGPGPRSRPHPVSRRAPRQALRAASEGSVAPPPAHHCRDKSRQKRDPPPLADGARIRRRRLRREPAWTPAVGKSRLACSSAAFLPGARKRATDPLRASWRIVKNHRKRRAARVLRRLCVLKTQSTRMLRADGLPFHFNTASPFDHQARIRPV